MRETAALSLAGAAAAALGGAIFWALHGDTMVTRAIAYGFWIAAAFCLLLMAVTGSKRVWRATSLPVLDGWMFVAAATVLTVAGAAIDAAGT